MERKSKEEILEKHFPTPEDHSDTSAILNAIQQYTDQEMALFLLWMVKGPYIEAGDPIGYTWVHVRDVGNDGKIKPSSTIYTLQQLLTIYKESNNILK